MYVVRDIRARHSNVSGSLVCTQPECLKRITEHNCCDDLRRKIDWANYSGRKYNVSSDQSPYSLSLRQSTFCQCFVEMIFFFFCLLFILVAHVTLWFLGAPSQLCLFLASLFLLRRQFSRYAAARPCADRRCISWRVCECDQSRVTTDGAHTVKFKSKAGGAAESFI